MSQWAEIRHLHLVEEVPKKEVARRLGVDVKTVRRALVKEVQPPRRESGRRPCRLDPWQESIEEWLRAEPKLTAKRIGQLLEPLAGPVPERTLRQSVARVRRRLFPREAFVHRTHAPGDTMEVDFGESWAEVAGRMHKLKYLVATLPHSNVYFGKAYPVERLECLIDGIQSAFQFFGGVPRRVVLDNTSLAVKRVLAGREREETEAFHGFRGAYPFHADFCAPAKGWEKGSTETGVRYVRNLCLRPLPSVATWRELNERLAQELVADQDRRRLPDGRTARQAWLGEREHLRPLPEHLPQTCRVLARVANKFGHVRVDTVTYSVPLEHAYQPVWVKLYHDRVEIAVAGSVVAVAERAFDKGALVLDPCHVLPLLERKHRAVPEATALQHWTLPEPLLRLREALRQRTRKPDQEWVRVLRLLEEYSQEAVEAAVAEALERDTPRLETIQQLLRQQDGPGLVRPAPLAASAPMDSIPAPDLASYDELGRNL